MTAIELLRRANGKYLRDLRLCPTRLVEVPGGQDSDDAEDGAGVD